MIERDAGQWHLSLIDLGRLPRPRGASSSRAKPVGRGGYRLLHGFETAAPWRWLVLFALSAMQTFGVYCSLCHAEQVDCKTKVLLP